MKNILTTLVIMVISLSVFGQNPFQKKFVGNDVVPAITPIDNAQFKTLKNSRMPANDGSRAVQQIYVDYDAVDEIVTLQDSTAFTYSRGFLNLNSNTDPNNTGIRGDLIWALVRFDSLYDANNLVGYPRSSTPVTVDSIDVYLAHENITGTPDTIIISVYKWQGTYGFNVNNDLEIMNQIWYADTIITTTSLTQTPTSFVPFTIYPDTQLTYPNNRFLVGVHFYGDTTNTFRIIVGAGDRCFEGCNAFPSSFEDNSWWNIVYWASPLVDLSGINGIVSDCNQNQMYDPEECESFGLENFNFAAYLTIDPLLTSTITASDNSICPTETVSLSVSPIGGTGPYNVSWTPTTGLSTPFSPTTNASPTATTTYTATIIDATPDTITKTVTITVNAITVDAGADQNIGCGQTANLVATPGGVLTGATFAWSNGVNTLNNSNVGAGTYTITATNSFGCSSSDAVVVAIPGVTQVLNFNTGLANNIGCKDVAITFTNTSNNTTGWSWAWTFGDNSGNISTAESPSYTYTANGPYTVTLSADSGGCTVAPVSKTVTINTCIGIEESWLSNQVEMYPNPTTGLVTLSFKDIDGKAGTVGVYDVTGKLAVEEQISVAGNAQKVMNLSSLADGVYFVKIQLGDGVIMRKLNVTR